MPFTQSALYAQVCLNQAHFSTSCLGNFLSLVCKALWCGPPPWHPDVKTSGDCSQREKGKSSAPRDQAGVSPLATKTPGAIWGGSTETAKWHASGSASFAWVEAHSSVRCSWVKPQGRCERPQGTVNTGERRQYLPFRDAQYSFWKHQCWKDSREITCRWLSPRVLICPWASSIDFG